MRNNNMVRRTSVRCAAAIMTAAMAMSPVAASVAIPMTAYAATYDTTDMIDATDGKIILNKGDTLTTNNGTVDVNNGTIETNATGATVGTNNGTVETNIGTITDNYGVVETNTGSVTINHIGGKVTGDSVNESYGTVTDNYGTVIDGTVTNNYAGGTVKGDGSNITNNWGNAVDNVNSVENNMGTVKGDTLVENQYSTGTVNGDRGTITDNIPQPDAGKAKDPNPPKQQTASVNSNESVQLWHEVNAMSDTVDLFDGSGSVNFGALSGEDKTQKNKYGQTTDEPVTLYGKMDATLSEGFGSQVTVEMTQPGDAAKAILCAEIPVGWGESFSFVIKNNGKEEKSPKEGHTFICHS